MNAMTPYQQRRQKNNSFLSLNLRHKTNRKNTLSLVLLYELDKLNQNRPYKTRIKENSLATKQMTGNDGIYDINQFG